MRRFVAAVGRSLISVGVLLLLFVAYQLWGTGIAYSKAQDRAKREFEQRLSAAGQRAGGSVEDEFSAGNLGAAVPPVAEDVPIGPTIPVEAATSIVPASIVPSSTVPSSTVPSSTVPASTVTASRPPTPVDVVPVASVAPPVTVTTLPKVRAGRSRMKRVPPGKVLGRLVIPRIKKDLGFVEGAGVEDLKGGPGHYVKTPLPGEEGNVGIACHRTTYGAPCFNLHYLRPGDPIFFQTDYGKFRYEVEWHMIVSPKDKKVLAPTPGESVLTITTCNPQYSAAQRYVVRARLVGPAVDTDLYFEPEVTVPPTTAVAAPVVSGGAAAADPVADDSTVSAVSTVEDPAENPAMEDSAAPVVAETTPDTAPVAASADNPTSLQAERPGTGRLITIGWFSGHQSYWVTTLLWMALCASIWLLAWLVARGRRLAGQAVIYGLGFVLLFLPALFFCFENLSHLLPENV